MFNPHTWPPNLEGVRGSPTATELITIDRQLFYDAMWGIWSFHPTIMRILSDNCASWFSLPRCCDATSSYVSPTAQDVSQIYVRSENWPSVSWLGGSEALPGSPGDEAITTLLRSLRSPDQPCRGNVLLMSCWAVLTAPASSYRHQGAAGRDISNHSRDPNLRLLK